MELAEQIIELTGSKSVIRFLPLPQDDPRQRKPDISPAKSILNWEPTVEIKYGLEKTIDYFKRSG
jgi:UDP-glucuronate decarboxylase